MKILWLINIPLPEVSELIGESATPYGGWLVNSSKLISQENEINLSITFPCKREQPFMIKGKEIIYYPFKPVKKVQDGNVNYFKKILLEVKPDLVHIYGTEMAHTLSMVKACNTLGMEVVISIQGLVSAISKHMNANLPVSAIYKKTLRNVINRDSVLGLARKFQKRGNDEIEAIKNINHVIGRTTWDRICVNQINPLVNYHHCNETLRESFYRQKWVFEKCEKHSIFLSQGSYSIKGLHHMIEALPLIIKEFPETKLYIGGPDITDRASFKKRLLQTYYGKYIKKRIDQLQLQEKIVFTGLLDEHKMCQRYLDSNIFVCPSSIENSPNSLGEAMLLGVPSVASFVGGVPDMLTHEVEGILYQSDAPYMLAGHINRVFSNQRLANNFSENSRKKALVTHSKEINHEQLKKIYQEILADKEFL